VHRAFAEVSVPVATKGATLQIEKRIPAMYAERARLALVADCKPSEYSALMALELPDAAILSCTRMARSEAEAELAKRRKS
jgi:hypothetical protein